jgi:hypothetical protein
MTSQNRPTHPLNVSYLVVGLVFIGIAGSWALRVTGVVDAADVRWLLPLVLVASGVVGLVAFAAKGLTRSRRHEPEALEHTDPYDPYDPYDAYDPYDPYDADSRSTDETSLLGRRTDDEGDPR